MNYPKPTKAELIEKYINQKMSSRAVAKEYGIDQKKVLALLYAYDIPSRSYAESAALTRNGFKDGEAHPNWVGDKVSYSSLHAWVRKHKGTPNLCEHCGATSRKKFEWANIDHKYQRNLDDYIRLCTSCHRLYDYNNNLA